MGVITIGKFYLNSRIKPPMYMYVRRNAMHEKVAIFSWNSTLACWFSPIKIHHFDYPKRFINRINEVYIFK